jgi:hypothetical protein
MIQILDENQMKIMQARWHGDSVVIGLTNYIKPGEYYIIQKGKIIESNEEVIILRKLKDQ